MSWTFVVIYRHVLIVYWWSTTRRSDSCIGVQFWAELGYNRLKWCLYIVTVVHDCECIWPDHMTEWSITVTPLFRPQTAFRLRIAGVLRNVSLSCIDQVEAFYTVGPTIHLSVIFSALRNKQSLGCIRSSPTTVSSGPAGLHSVLYCTGLSLSSTARATVWVVGYNKEGLIEPNWQFLQHQHIFLVLFKPIVFSHVIHYCIFLTTGQYYRLNMEYLPECRDVINNLKVSDLLNECCLWTKTWLHLRFNGDF